MLSRWFEQSSKTSITVACLEALFPMLEALHFEPTSVWEECGLKSFLERKKAITRDFPSHLVKCCGAATLAHWKDHKDFPDSLGNRACSALYSEGDQLWENIFFNVKTPDGRFGFRLNKQAVVAFSLKDIGFNRRFFLRLIRRLSRIDLLGYTDLTLNQNLERIYSFTEHQKQMDYLLLKYTRKVFWHGRKHSNQHLSESYLLYRQAYYAMLQYKFLDYILQRINDGLEPLRKEFGFEGKITTSLPRIDYKKYLEEYYAGIINASQLGDIIFKKTIPAVD